MTLRISHLWSFDQ